MSNIKNERREGVIGGIILTVIGTLVLVGQAVDTGWLGGLIPLGLGIIFMSWGILKREAGLMIPGGILGGIGVGIALIGTPLGDLPLLSTLVVDDGAVFMGAFALGWFSITIASALFARETMWWALIPGGIFALIAAGIGLGGAFLSALSLLGTYWPVLLIIAGLVIVVRQLRGPHADGGEKSFKA
jgi:hypothetical protein